MKSLSTMSLNEISARMERDAMHIKKDTSLSLIEISMPETTDMFDDNGEYIEHPDEIIYGTFTGDNFSWPIYPEDEMRMMFIWDQEKECFCTWTDETANAYHCYVKRVFMLFATEDELLKNWFGILSDRFDIVQKDEPYLLKLIEKMRNDVKELLDKGVDKEDLVVHKIVNKYIDKINNKFLKTKN